jgi:hypothetical protein
MRKYAKNCRPPAASRDSFFLCVLAAFGSCFMTALLGFAEYFKPTRINLDYTSDFGKIGIINKLFHRSSLTVNTK